MRNYLYFSLIFTFCSSCLLGKPSQGASETSKSNQSEESLIFDEFMSKAQYGDAAAQFKIGIYFKGGDKKAGVEQSKQNAEDWFLKSARQGYPAALAELSTFYSPNYSKSANTGTDSNELAESKKWRYLYDLKRSGVEKWDKPIRGLSEETKFEAIKRAKQFLEENSSTFNNFYWVERGDNIGTIAKKTGISQKTIEKLNPYIDWKKVSVGDRINLK